MSLEENVKFVKEELTSQEEFLSSFVKAERFYNKHKMQLIGLSVVIVVLVLGFVAKNYMDDRNKILANEAFTKFLENPKDAQALTTLQESNNDLFQIANYMNAKKENKIASIDVKYLKELNEFDQAMKANDLAKLEALSMNDNFLLKEYAIFYRALILAQQDKIAESNAVLKTIPAESNLKELVNLLKHYLITKG